MQLYRRVALVAALAVMMTVSAARWAVASSTPKWSMAELADFSDVIVTGRVESVAGGWDPAVNTIYTYVVVDVDEVLKGAIGRGRIVVKQLGGSAGATNLHVFDQPTFVAGESVLLYLEIRPRDGSLYTAALWQGKWTLEGDTATRFEPAGHRSAFPVDRQALGNVRGLTARQDLVRSAYVNTAPADAAAATARPYVLLGPYRYFFSPAIDVQTGGQPGLPGGGIAEIQASIDRWNSAGSSFRFSFGSSTGPVRCSTEELGNSRVTISFNDPCGEISNAGLTLAIAGSYSTTDGGAIINGQAFERALEGFVVNNDGANASEVLTQSGCFADTQLHELGHVLGLDHTSDSSAIMFPSINPGCSSGPSNLGVDDLNGLLFIYPPGGGGGGMTPPSSAPTGVTVVVNGTASITVSFNAVSALFAAQPAAATGYRLDFRQSANGPILASLTTATTSTVIPLPPGTTGTFNVTVTGVNGAGSGPSSTPVSFTIGSSGPGPCTSAPASPTVNGTLVGGTATVSWNAVPGATFYILSAGTTQGGTNLSPTANIGMNTTVQATGLPPGFTAWVRVVAGNACGQSAPTDFFLSGSGGPPAPGPGGASVQFRTSANACQCWFNPITVRIDGNTAGSMSCNGMAGPFSVSPGAHTVQACDAEGCVDDVATIASGDTFTLTVTCTSALQRSFSLPF